MSFNRPGNSARSNLLPHCLAFAIALAAPAIAAQRVHDFATLRVEVS
jgi:hypothetical protein